MKINKKEQVKRIMKDFNHFCSKIDFSKVSLDNRDIFFMNELSSSLEALIEEDE